MSLLLAECLRVTLTTLGGVLKFFYVRESCVVILYVVHCVTVYYGRYVIVQMFICASCIL